MKTKVNILDRDINKSNTIICHAYRIAFDAHAGQYRKYTNEPYIEHPLAVARIVADVIDNEYLVAGALLHDVIEDTELTFKDLKDQGTNEWVIRVVKDLTEFSQLTDGNRAYRKMLDRRYLSRVCAGSKTVKLADLIHNTYSIVKEDPNFAMIYMKEKKLLLEVLTEGNQELFMKADGLIKTYYNGLDDAKIK